jgi:DNA-binding NtrC family response regulator
MPGKKILLVDDETVFTENMSRLLINRGFNVTAVERGEDAVQLIEKEKYDVVVLDLKMPGINGIDTLKEIKKLDTFTEVLILTGHGSIDTAMESLKLGAYDYLIKPCGIDELVMKLEGARERKESEEKKDMESKIRKIVESPSSVFDLFPKRK